MSRGLAACGCDVKLLTDVWASPDSGRWLPARWRQRFHSDISRQNVNSWNVSALLLQCRLAASRLTTWQRIFETDRWFQRRAARLIRELVDGCETKPIVFAYSYAAKEIFETARQLGCPTILGQIDPGPVEMRLVQQLESKYDFQNSEWPVRDYWDDWKQECELADMIVVNSEWSRTALLEEGVEASRIKVIPLAYERVPDDSYSKKQCPGQFTSHRPLRVLFLGQVNLRKGIKEMAEAVRLLQNQPVEWTIVGGGDPTLLNELRALPQTVVTGPVSREEVIGFYRDADVFLLPTHSDGFALTQLEAAAYDLPIIASQRCGDVVVHEENGLRLSTVSGSDIAASVQRLISDPLLLQRMRRAQQDEPQVSLRDLGQRLVESVSQIKSKRINV